MKNSTAFIIIVSFCCVAAIGLYSFFVPIVTEDSGAVYDLAVGTSKHTLVADLTKQGVVKHPFLFSIYGYLLSSPYLKSGEYLFPKGSTVVSMWHQVTSGKGFLNHPLKIIPGWTFAQLRSALKVAPGLVQTLNDMDDKQVMKVLGYPNLLPEGEFYPDTYFYTKGVTDQRMLKRALVAMQKRLAAAWLGREQGLPYDTPYQALIAASLIEREAYLNSERPVIASVLVNRLRKGMLLQIDASVIYGMGDHYDGKITKRDLTTDTIYNTYVHKGLPPTPIAMPCMASILAALHPIQSDYLYYVAKGDGSHQFSRDLTEHNAAVAAALKHPSGYFNKSKVSHYLQQTWLEKMAYE